MIKAIIKIRLLQLKRGIIEIGILRSIFLLALISFAGMILFDQTSRLPNNYYISGGLILMLLHIHIKRQDKSFLKTNAFNSKHIFFIEYLLLSSPVLFLLFYHAQWNSICIIALSLVLIVSTDLKARQNNLNTKFQEWIPDEVFEWKAGLRKTLFIILPVWSIAFFTSFYIGSVPVAIFILGLVPISYYEQCEPWQMVISFERNAFRFLIQKIKQHLILFTVLVIPLMIAFLLFHPGFWYIPLGEILIFSCLHIYVILTKYAFYESNVKSPAVQIFIAIGAIGALIPIFLPLVWLLSIRFFFKSQENLTSYLNDYN